MKGMETLELLQRYQDSMEKQTKACLETQLGSRAPQIYEGLGAALKLLTELATCQWGCRGGAHTVENLVRRVCNYTSASLRLAHLGLYDEALTLVRPVSEIGNLLQLFQIDSEALRRWNQLPERERRKEFGPAIIRKAIEIKNQTPIVGSDAYSKLSEICVSNCLHCSGDRRPARSLIAANSPLCSHVLYATSTASDKADHRELSGTIKYMEISDTTKGSPINSSTIAPSISRQSLRCPRDIIIASNRPAFAMTRRLGALDAAMVE